jgi:hypothetical protein
MKRLPPDQAKKIADDAKLAKAWRKWHEEELAEARNGPHGAIVTELMIVLDRLTTSSAPALLACFERPDWNAVHYDVRLVVLHELNTAITRLREQQSMPPFDDGVPGERDNVFRRIKDLMFAAPPGAHAGSNHTQQRSNQTVKQHE